MIVSVFDSERDNRPLEHDLTWEQIGLWLGQCRETACSPCPGSACKAKYGPAWSPARFAGTRANANVVEVGALVVDLDHLTEERMQEIGERLQGLRCHLHTTHSDREGDRCLRVVIELSAPVPAADWPRFWRAAMASLDLPADPATCDASRLYFLPSSGNPAHFGAGSFDGAPLDVILTLSQAPAEPASTAPAPADRGATAKTGPSESEHAVALALLARHWPKRGRHYASLALCGALARAGWPEDAIAEFVTALAAAVNGDDGEPGKRAAQAADSVAKVSQGLEVSGWPTLIETHGIPRTAVVEVCGALGIPFESLADAAAGVAEMLAALGADSWSDELAKAWADLQAYRGTASDGSGKHSTPAFDPAGSLFTRELPPTAWLVQGLLTEASVGVTSAEPKSCKTWAELELDIAVATGTPAFGEFRVEKPGAVALFLAEDNARGTRNRLRALAAARGMSPAKAVERVHVACRKSLDITQDVDLVWIIASCRRIRDLVLVEIDPLRDIHTGDENDSSAMADVMGRLRALRDIVGCSVRFVHHSAKTGADTSKRRQGQKMRGSGAVHGAVDCGLYLDGLDTDGQSRWESHVEVEIKAAKGAGRFDLVLEVEDDLAGEAIKATWKVVRDTPERRAEEEKRALAEDEARVLAVIAQHGSALNWRDLRERTGIGAKRAGEIRVGLELAGKIRRAYPLDEDFKKKRGEFWEIASTAPKASESAKFDPKSPAAAFLRKQR